MRPRQRRAGGGAGGQGSRPGFALTTGVRVCPSEEGGPGCHGRRALSTPLGSGFGVGSIAKGDLTGCQGAGTKKNHPKGEGVPGA